MYLNFSTRKMITWTPLFRLFEIGVHVDDRGPGLTLRILRRSARVKIRRSGLGRIEAQLGILLRITHYHEHILRGVRPPTSAAFCNSLCRLILFFDPFFRPPVLIPLAIQNLDFSM